MQGLSRVCKWPPEKIHKINDKKQLNLKSFKNYPKVKDISRVDRKTWGLRVQNHGHILTR
jgi:hypothetical protein